MMMSNQQQLQELLKKGKMNMKEREGLVMIIRNGGYDMPDVLFQNAYLSYREDPKTDQKYINMQSIIYGGLQIKFGSGFLKKFLLSLKKQIGSNQYIQRIKEVINFASSSQPNPNYLNDLTVEDQGDCESIKKKIASFKKHDSFENYVSKINEYLQMEPSDQEAWIQLSQIYTQKGNYMKAAFCYEELIMLNPNNDDYIQKLAQLYLTLGNKANEEKAIKYLSYITSKRPDNMRALWTLFRATRTLQPYAQLNKICSANIHKIYSQQAPELKIDLGL